LLPFPRCASFFSPCMHAKHTLLYAMDRCYCLHFVPHMPCNMPALFPTLHHCQPYHGLHTHTHILHTACELCLLPYTSPLPLPSTSPRTQAHTHRTRAHTHAHTLHLASVLLDGYALDAPSRIYLTLRATPTPLRRFIPRFIPRHARARTHLARTHAHTYTRCAHTRARRSERLRVTRQSWRPFAQCAATPTLPIHYALPHHYCALSRHTSDEPQRRTHIVTGDGRLRTPPPTTIPACCSSRHACSAVWPSFRHCGTPALHLPLRTFTPTHTPFTYLRGQAVDS